MPVHCCFIYFFFGVIFIVAFSYDMSYWFSFNGRNVGFSFPIIVFSKDEKKKSSNTEDEQGNRPDKWVGIRHEAASQGHLDTAEIEVTTNN